MPIILKGGFKMETIQISSKLYPYSVSFTDSFDKELEEYNDRAVYIIDRNIYQLYSAKLSKIPQERIYFVDAVEHNKNMDSVLRIIEFFQKMGVRKNWHVICMGGGITQDLVTISSNLYLRNVEWIFFPTTLLSMCDSCIGGKCGINFGRYKNQIGVFYPPKKIILDTQFTSTLRGADYINGWGELLKFSLTSDPTFFEELKQEQQYVPCPRIAAYIHRGLTTKKAVIEQDEFESDFRRVLNYGHTFGHALEAYTDNRIPHGQAVIWGIDVVNYFSWREGLIDRGYYLEIKSLIKRAFIKEEMKIEQPQMLFDIIRTDKKALGNILNFAMLDAPSHLIVHPMAIDEKLAQLFMSYLEETHEYYHD